MVPFLLLLLLPLLLPLLHNHCFNYDGGPADFPANRPLSPLGPLGLLGLLGAVGPTFHQIVH